MFGWISNVSDCLTWLGQKQYSPRRVDPPCMVQKKKKHTHPFIIFVKKSGGGGGI